MTRAPDAQPRAEVSAAMQRAAAFVESAGDEVAIGRARALVGTQPASVVVELLRDLGSEPSVGRLLRMLGILADLRCTNAAPIERACACLSASQQSDGSWSDPESTADDERIFATGMIAGYLAKTPSFASRLSRRPPITSPRVGAPIASRDPRGRPIWRISTASRSFATSRPTPFSNGAAENSSAAFSPACMTRFRRPAYSPSAKRMHFPAPVSRWLSSSLGFSTSRWTTEAMFRRAVPLDARGSPIH